MAQPVYLAKAQPGNDPARRILPGRRAFARLRLAIPARLLATHATGTCVLLDLSRTGARIGLADPLPPGDMLYLRLAGFEVFAEVVWRELGDGGGINGLTFDEPLDEAAVLDVRHFAEGFEQREREMLREQVRSWVEGQIRL
jgi:hypothetical protein